MNVSLHRSARTKNGFTILEVLIVMVIIAILATIVLNYYGGAKERAYLKKADSELNIMASAVKFYTQKYNAYPPDVNRGLPAGLNEFLSADQGKNWPDGPWPGSVYDYDYFNNSGETVQISIRFCPIGGPLSACKFPPEPWAANFGVDSSYYYCIKGNCKAHPSQPDNYPGYCVNCPGNKAILG